MRLMRVWVPTEFATDDQTRIITHIEREPHRGAEHLFTTWEDDGSGCWVTWRLGDFDSELTEEVLRSNAD